jgi:rRNA processing protein Gar1
LKKKIERPLGPVLHIIRNEAITKPLTPFIGKGLTVIIKKEDLHVKIGKLGDPFGSVIQPYQPIFLMDGVGEEIIGEEAIAIKVERSKRSAEKRKKSKKRRYQDKRK